LDFRGRTIAPDGPVGTGLKDFCRLPTFVDFVLADAARAQVLAAETINAVKDIVGFAHR
jgi:tryptophanyl-tRNA synthetase